MSSDSAGGIYILSKGHSLIGKLAVLAFASALVFFIASAIFWQTYETSDIHAHSRMALDYQNANGLLPANVLYYYSILFLNFHDDIKSTSVLLLAALVAMKFIVVNGFISARASKQDINFVTVTFFSLALLFLMSIYIPQLIIGRFYLGSFPPNIWHNSTVIAVTPFSILLFQETCKQIDCWSWPRIYLIALLIIINALIKPSYLFAYVLALPITALWFRKVLVRYFAISFFAIVLVVIEYLLIYSSDAPLGGRHSVAVMPFLGYRYWHSMTSNIPLGLIVGFFAISAIFSYVFPVYATLKEEKAGENIESVFSFISVLVAMLIGILFVEVGPRAAHGNFFWQIYICTFIFFLVSTTNALPNLASVSHTNVWWRLSLYQVLFLLHLIFGIAYIWRLILLKQWY